MTDLTAERNRSAFALAMARAQSDATLWRIPHNPLRPDVVVTLGGLEYALVWLHVSFDTLSPSSKSAVTITCRATGEQVGISPVWRKERRTKAGEARVTYTVKGEGSWDSYDEACAGLVAIAAARLGRGRVAA
ncbi:hypothetical protein [Deinococcus sp. NW-56]|uniref:hypothetical protein n=1 Tax=Deinococcus sp. NW-56 TaxID=2080419 RepID=UPI000CF3DC6B|nr:hypothetical protein [Deinococcus sp. NW-56]